MTFLSTILYTYKTKQPLATSKADWKVPFHCVVAVGVAFSAKVLKRLRRTSLRKRTRRAQKRSPRRMGEKCAAAQAAEEAEAFFDDDDDGLFKESHSRQRREKNYPSEFLLKFMSGDLEGKEGRRIRIGIIIQTVKIG